MKKTNFSPEDFKRFEDKKNIMKFLFEISCSVCGIDEITYVAQNAPKPIGDIASDSLAENADLTDDELDKIIEQPLQAWQEVDDYNASIGMPTFVCASCYHQLIAGEIQISDIDSEE
ncbi:hypothetical protein SHELI_v1c02950 [Spiroplasma helicoides]|uniref:Uncharacterized protein n=1 Tax=Spiroplasma helicoides TaxID=216938 RepID=A0A1B3SJZ6_9MOLU|nr:hypothetical protein [Spiroplasma helicoides]AOG60250.1 hypothetical protein SHELI_v1c02950 [Spiroplasma helicoides]